MFHNIPERLAARMAELERRDGVDREDGTPKLARLRQIPAETGRFLALLAAGAPPGRVIEIGTSAGNSALWLSLACRETGRGLTTFEVLPEKVWLARETLATAGVEDVVELVAADAREQLGSLGEIGFCFLDAEKDVYDACYDLVVPHLVPGGLLVADNVLSHEDELRPFVERAIADPRLDALVVPIGKGKLRAARRSATGSLAVGPRSAAARALAHRTAPLRSRAW